jgi:hypothetical protein
MVVRTSVCAKQLLHRTNVGTGFEQVRGKGMAEGMARHTLADIRRVRGVPDGALEQRLTKVMSAADTTGIAKCRRLLLLSEARHCGSATHRAVLHQRHSVIVSRPYLRNSAGPNERIVSVAR